MGAAFRALVAARMAWRRWWLFTRLKAVARARGVALELTVEPEVNVGRGVTFELGGSRVRWRIGRGSAIADGVHFHLVDADVDLGPGTRFKRECLIYVFGGRLVFEGIGGLSQRCIVHCADEIVVQQYTAVSEYTTLVDSAHVVPSSPTEDNWLRHGEVETAPVRIGSYVFVGAKVTVLKGVTIGDHSIVAANSLVTRDVPPHSMVVGVPARRIRRPDPVEPSSPSEQADVPEDA